MDNSKYKELVDKRGELFEQFEKRVKDKELVKSKEYLSRHTNYVVDAILKFVLDIFSKADTNGELIKTLDDPDLGILGKPQEEDGIFSQYSFDDDGLTIYLNYTKSNQPLYTETQYFTPKTHNFAEYVDWESLRRILGAYGIEIDRVLKTEDALMYKDDLVTIKVRKHYMKNNTIGQTGEPVNVHSMYYNYLVTNRDQLFKDVQERIARRKRLEGEEQIIADTRSQQEIEETEKAIVGILKLVKDILENSDDRTAKITNDDIDPSLGILGNDLGGTLPSHYSFDEVEGLTISLNYSHNKEEGSYANCFGNTINWNYLIQILKEYGIEIDRSVHERYANRDQSYHFFDIVTIKVANFSKNFAPRTY